MSNNYALQKQVFLVYEQTIVVVPAVAAVGWYLAGIALHICLNTGLELKKNLSLYRSGSASVFLCGCFFKGSAGREQHNQVNRSDHCPEKQFKAPQCPDYAAG